MKKLTIYDPFRIQRKKTKSWLDGLTCLILILIGQITFAQSMGTIQIGTGTTTSNSGPQTMPFTSTLFIYSQQIVTASEYQNGGGTAGAITKIRYYITTTGTLSRWNNWTVYIGNTSKTEFTSNTDWIPVSEMTEVFSGIITPDPIANDWFEITFTEPFEYTGGNIVVAVDENALLFGGPQFRSYTSTSNSGILRSNTANINPSSPAAATARVSNLAQIQFEGTLATCLKPTNLTVTSFTQNSANLSWTSEGNLFDIEYGVQGFSPTENPNITGVSNPYILDNLQPSTSYQYYVRVDCGEDDGTSDWEGPYSFTTAQIPATLDYEQDFEENYNWTLSNGNQINKWVIGEATQNGGNRSLYVSNDNGLTNSYSTNSNATVHAYRDVMIPENIANIEFSFDWKAGGFSDWDHIRVWLVPATYIPIPGTLITTENSGGTQLGTYHSSPSEWVNESLTLTTTEYSGQVMRFVFEWMNFAYGSYPPSGAIDNIEIYIPVCSTPTNIGISDITTTTVELNWISEGTLFDIEWGLKGFIPTENPNITEITNNYLLEDLNPGTKYQYYVRQNCNSGLTSAWAGPFDFTTTCNVVTSGFFEGFDTVPTTNIYVPNSLILPDCWSIITNVNGGIGTTTQIVSSEDNPSPSAPNHFSFYSGWDNTGYYILVSPETDNFGNGNYRVRFFARTNNSVGTINLIVGTLIDPLDPSTFTILETFTLSNIFTEYGVYLPEGSANYFGFKHGMGDGINIEIDSITYEENPVCPDPLVLNAENITPNSALISWIAPGNLFDVEYGVSGFTLGEGTKIFDITTNSTNLNTLSADTIYDFYVRSKCGEEQLSEWSGPYTFYTGYCEVSMTGNEASGYGIFSFETTGAITNIYNLSGYEGSPNGYGNYTNLNLSQYETGEINFTATSTISGALNIWVDWNNNLEFEENEKVYGAGNPLSQDPYFSSGPFIGSFSVPEGTQLGNYRMRVRNGYFSQNPSPCGGGSGPGETEDYTLTVVPEPICTLPSQLGADLSSDFTSADLFWTGEGISFDIQYGPMHFTLGNGTIISELTTNSTTIEDLTPYNYYQYYIRQYCNDGSISPWTGPYTFFNEYCIADSFDSNNSDTSNMITSFSISGGISNFTNETGSVASPSSNSYMDYTNISTSHFPMGAVSFEVIVQSTFISNTGIWIDWNNNLEFEANEKVYASGTVGTAGNADGESNNLVGTGTIFVPVGTLPGNYRMRVRTHSQVSSPNSPCGTIISGETEDYTFTVIASPPSCMPPNQVTQTLLSNQTSIELSWTSTGTAFEVEYGAHNFILGNGNVVEGITTTGTTLTDLTPDTYYHYYVRQNCGEEFSLWTGPYTFYTGYCQVYYNEDIGLGMSGIRNHITSFTTGGGITNISNSTNTISPGGYGDFTDLSVSSFEGGEISVILDGASPFGETYGINVWIDWNNNHVFEENEKVYTTMPTENGTTLPTEFSFTIPQGLPLGDYRIRVRTAPLYKDPTPCGYFSFGEVEDYTLTIIPNPSCIPPTELGANILPTQTSVNLFWTGEGTNFEIQYGLQNFVLGNGTSLTGISDNETTISGLSADTYYKYYVRLNCGGDDISAWAGPYTFYTGYCQASSNSVYNYISSFTTTGGIGSNISNSSGGNGYSNYTNMSVNHFETGTIDFKIITQGFEPVVNVWVDWNKNFIFEENEKVYSFNTTGSNFNGTATFQTDAFITVPLGTEVGDYRIRVRLGSSVDPSSCGTISWGETEDYTFTVITPPACLPVIYPTSTMISPFSTSLSWESNGELFEIEYGPVGFTPGTGTTISEVGNPYLLNELTPGTTYQYYVRQDCGEDSYSFWSDPVTFISGAYSGDIPTSLNTNPTVEDVACVNSPYVINVPEGYYLSSLNVQYSMISYNTAWASEQRSLLYSPTLNTGESIIASSNIDFPGIINYTRNVDFANEATGTIEFILKAWRTNHGSGCNTDYVYVVNNSWILTPTFELIPSCPAPTNLNVVNITENSVELTWESEEGNLFEILWGEAGFNINNQGTFIPGITETSHSLLNLDSSILYEFYVRKNCSTQDEEDYSNWVGPFKFNSGYCIPTSTIGYYISSFATTQALNNINHTSDVMNGGYKNQTNLAVSQEAGASFNFTANYVGGASGLKIWVDWNNNLIFEDDEELFYQANGIGYKTGTINIPSNQNPGNYVMRVRAELGSSAVPPACGNIGNGEAVDFTLNVACYEIVAPVGNTAQDFEEGDTLANLDVTGDNLVWYADSELTEVLEDVTLLVNGTTYYVVNEEGSCQSEVLAVIVHDICIDFPNPIGNTEQDFEEGDTLANLDVTGDNLVWYSDSELTEVLEDVTLLVNGTTYYVVNEEGSCQSEVLAVTVNEVLSTSDFDSFSFGYQPNPVNEVLYLRANAEISEVVVFNMLGQILSLPIQSNNTQIDMTGLPSGNYVMSVTIEGVTKTFKVVKK